jgi:hypothetical protein
MSNYVFVGHRFSKQYSDDFREKINEAISSYSKALVPTYADDLLVTGHIFNDKIKPMIDESLLCIFDITEINKPNVFIEIGYAFGINKKVVLTSKKNPPSDLAGFDILKYDSFHDLKVKLLNYLPLILNEVIFNGKEPVFKLPPEASEVIWYNYNQGNETKKSELRNFFSNPSDLEKFISILVNTKLFNDLGKSISLTTEGIEFFSSMFKNK